jgi:hypothetical protein
LTPEDFRSQAGGRLKGITTEDREIVERHQPYHWGGIKSDHPLALLDDFVRKDKHRMLHVVFGRPGDTRVVPQPTKTFLPERLVPGPVLNGAVLQPGAEIVRVYGTPIGPGEAELNVRFETFTSVALENGIIITDLLEWSLASVCMVLAEFDTLFWSRHYAATRS